MHRRIVALLAGTAVALTACGGVQGGSAARDAAGFPTKPVELTVPSSAGGSSDLIGRAVARAVEKPLGTSVPVVNKPGANGAVGGKEVLGSSPDGHRLVMLFKSLMSITPLAVDDPDAIRFDQMTVVAPLTVEDYVLVVPAASPHRTVADLVGAGRLSYGTTGAGTGSQLAQALLFGAAKVDATDVPFDGGAPTITALLGSQVDAAVIQIAEAAPQVDAGALRPLAVFSEARIPFLKDVPTAKELGYDVVVDQRRFLAAPAGLAPEALATLQKAVATAQQDPRYTEFLEKNYISPWTDPADQVIPHLEAAKKGYADVIAASGITFKES
ncbi:Bug family tripartite tricarboxylate transporter substrate binding protein [Pseudonocardia sp. TRM90224]|uniref:Bug family tripartite tricarboxylate transporter substrate binding protein n=1 Tax=Pseudonocardia sp. TRM90224 TaxID=2812678 RepID=UPI001E54B3FB|nr:tripartite tricarboxylate transporter substrate binding protein [Pseudonocardia sp. TRM90224]